MGNKSTIDTQLPSRGLRIKAFVRGIASRIYDHDVKTKIDAYKLSLALLENEPNEIDISSTALSNWEMGLSAPKKSNIQKLEKAFPGSTLILNSDDFSIPLNRLLCSIDILGSRYGSALRKQDIVAGKASVGACLKRIAEDWGAYELSENNKIYHYYIPKIKDLVPSPIDCLQYRAYDRYYILLFMFQCGAYIDFENNIFEDWALDIASATAMIVASIDEMSSSAQSLSGALRDLSIWLYNIFYVTHKHSTMFSENKLISDLSKKHPNLDNNDAINYAKRLLLVRQTVEDKLKMFDCDLETIDSLYKQARREGGFVSDPINAQQDKVKKTLIQKYWK